MKKIRFHGQNLNEDRAGNICGTWLKDHRAWFYFWKLTIAWQVQFFKWDHILLKFEWGGYDNEDFGFTIGLPGFFFALDFNGILPKRWKNYNWERTTGISIHNGTIYFSIWNDDSWSGQDKPKWQEFCFNYTDFFLGKAQYSTETLSFNPRVAVPMPEHNYWASVRIFQSTWKRSRWFVKRLTRTEIKLPKDKPIPVLGKGENSYDCGDDAIYSLTCPEVTEQNAVAALVQSALRTREKYGWHTKTETT